MGQRFKGRLAIVTASTAGIGLAIAERLAQEGAKVVISSRKVENVQSAESALQEKQHSVKGVVCHVGDRKAIQNLIQEALSFGDGSIDILVSNAAVSPVMAKLSETPERAIDAVLRSNIKAAILLVQAALPYFSDGASVVFNSSITAFHAPLRGQELMGMYAVSKTALLGITKAFANELGPKGVRVNCVAPGFVPTKLSNELLENDVVRTELMKVVPLGRLGRTEEIAGVVAFLVSKDAAYVTGETVVVGGGLQSRL